MDFDSLQGRSQTEVDFQTHLPRFLPISAARAPEILFSRLAAEKG